MRKETRLKQRVKRGGGVGVCTILSPSILTHERVAPLLPEGDRRSDLSRLLISEKTEYESRAIVYYRGRNGWDYSCCVKLNRENAPAALCTRVIPNVYLVDIE